MAEAAVPTADALTADIGADAPAVTGEESLVEELLEDELLVEDVSIDGMCGVY